MRKTVLAVAVVLLKVFTKGHHLSEDERELQDAEKKMAVAEKEIKEIAERKKRLSEAKEKPVNWSDR